MRLTFGQVSVAVLAGVMVLCAGGCSSAPFPSVASGDPTPISTASTATATATAPSDASHSDSADVSAFDQQLPLTGSFVSQWTETVGSIEIARRADGTVWATLSNFSTGASPNLKLFLNQGELVEGADGFWTTDIDGSWDIAPVNSSLGTQEIEIRGTNFMPEIQSATIIDYGAPDVLHYGSAPLE